MQSESYKQAVAAEARKRREQELAAIRKMREREARAVNEKK